jgi:hypothetical protein
LALTSGDPLTPPPPVETATTSTFSMEAVGLLAGSAEGTIDSYAVVFAPPVPALSPWALVVLAGSLAAAGGWRAWRRAPAAA